MFSADVTQNTADGVNLGGDPPEQLGINFTLNGTFDELVTELLAFDGNNLPSCFNNTLDCVVIAAHVHGVGSGEDDSESILFKVTDPKIPLDI